VEMRDVKWRLGASKSFIACISAVMRKRPPTLNVFEAGLAPTICIGMFGDSIVCTSRLESLPFVDETVIVGIASCGILYQRNTGIKNGGSRSNVSHSHIEPG